MAGSAKKKNTAGNKKKGGKQKKNLRHEFQGVLLIAVGVILLACLIMGDSAVVPRYINMVLLGSFGLLAYVIPVLFAVFGVFRIILKKITIHKGKLASTIVFVLSLIGFIHCICVQPYNEQLGFFPALGRCFEEGAARSANMGLFAELYIYPLTALLGRPLTMILMIAGVAATVILLFNFSYREAGKKVKEKIDVISDHAATYRENLREEREKRRQAQMFDDLIEDDEPCEAIKEEHFNGEVQTPLSVGKARKITITSHYDNMPQEQNEPEKMEEDVQEREMELFAETETPKRSERGEGIFTPPKDSAQVYRFPPVSLLNPPPQIKHNVKQDQTENIEKLESTLRSFGIGAQVENITIGPAITRYELTIARGVRVNRIAALADDIALAMAATGVRIEAPIPGKSAVGIEIPNGTVSMVSLREVIESEAFRNSSSCVTMALGKDITGRPIVADISKMPHLLIAGQTGSGKSVAINCLIISLLYKSRPEDVRMILIDPKKVELSVYNGIPNLLLPVVTDPKKAAGALQYVVREMENRYSEFNRKKVKDIARYNEVSRQAGEPGMPRIVVIVDELNDLMMVAPGEVEDSVMRIAQLARAAGIYLVLATQRPSVNVITGVIKANIPSRMAFAVSSSHDSRTILDMVGAEKLLGRGDMLYHHNGEFKPLRVQGAFIDEIEVERVVNFIKESASEPEYIEEECIELVGGKGSKSEAMETDDDSDELLPKAIEIVIDNEQASISLLQRKLGIGYARAGRIIDTMERMHIIGASQGSKPREIIMSRQQYNEIYRKD